MIEDRTANLLGALALTLVDALRVETDARAAHGAAAPAALVAIGIDPGQSIDALATTLCLSHSATVRLVERLERDGLVRRGAAADGRVAALHLTRRGAARRRAVLDGRHRVLARALRVLSPDESAQFAVLAERILGAWTRDRRHADHICRLCDEARCPGETCPVERAVP